MSVAIERFEQEKERGLIAIYQKYFPGERRTIARDKQIMEVCNRFAQGEVVPEPDLYSLALQYEESLPDTAPQGPAATYAAESGAQQSHQASDAQEQANRAAWEQILLKYAMASHDANYAMVRDYCGNNITLEKFEFLINNQPKGFNLDWTDEREQLLNEILDLLYDPYGRRMTTADLKSARLQMQYWSRAQLRARLAEVKDRQALAKKFVPQIQNDLRAIRKAQEVERPYPGFITLLSTMVPRFPVPAMGWNTVQAVNTKDLLDYYVKHDYPEFKRIVGLAGSQQVDDIRMGRRYS